MKYRAILITIRPMERALQQFSNSIARISQWAQDILAERGFEDEYVKIYETHERLIDTILPEESTPRSKVDKPRHAASL